MAKRTGLLLGISILWLPLSMLFDGLNTLILPSYLLRMGIETNQASLLGFISLVGLLIGMIAQAVAGAYSDRTRSRWGRRGIISFGMLALLLLLLLPEFLQNVFLLFLLYILIQLASNVVQAALQGFIPDLIKPSERGMASGIKNLMDIGGALLVFILLAELFNTGQTQLILPLIALVFLIAYVLTLIFVREPEEPEAKPLQRLTLADIFQLNLREHRYFAWLIISRFLFLLGTYAVGRFLLFFVAERLDLEANSAGEQSANIFAILTLITVLAAPVAGWLSDKLNRQWLMICGGLMSALAVTLLMTVNSSSQILIYGTLLALGSAIFSTANWALTADFAPTGEAARYLAIANFGTAGAAAAAGIFGPLIDFGNLLGEGMGYSLLFAAASAAFLASSLAVQRIELRPAVSEQLSKQ